MCNMQIKSNKIPNRTVLFLFLFYRRGRKSDAYTHIHTISEHMYTQKKNKWDEKRKTIAVKDTEHKVPYKYAQIQVCM